MSSIPSLALSGIFESHSFHSRKNYPSHPATPVILAKFPTNKVYFHLPFQCTNTHFRPCSLSQFFLSCFSSKGSLLIASLLGPEQSLEFQLQSDFAQWFVFELLVESRLVGSELMLSIEVWLGFQSQLKSVEFLWFGPLGYRLKCIHFCHSKGILGHILSRFHRKMH